MLQRWQVAKGVLKHWQTCAATSAEWFSPSVPPKIPRPPPPQKAMSHQTNRYALCDVKKQQRGFTRSMMKYPPLAWMSTVPATQDNQHHSEQSKSLTGIAPLITLNIHSLHWKCKTDAVCIIYRLLLQKEHKQEYPIFMPTLLMSPLHLSVLSSQLHILRL